MKKLSTFILLTLLILPPNMGLACSMYKISKNGKTIVGNNEDYFSPNSKFWFEKGSRNTFGVMYIGLLNNFAQGAINEAGLVFDGFWEPFLEVKGVEGELDVPIGAALKKVMQHMTNVEDVQTYLLTINLNSLVNGQLVFVDKSGTYLIVEGDEMFIGDETEKTFSNFYYSQIESLDDVKLDYFNRGQDFINKTTKEEKNTINYCAETMQHFAQSRLSPTQYSTIYDLDALTIRVYLFHDFSEFIELDLKKELRKGNHSTMIADLFPKESIGYLHYEKYNNPQNPTLFLEEYLEVAVGENEITEQDFLSNGFDNIINSIGYEWLKDIKDPIGAIKVFQYGVKLMPSSANLHEGLGEAYFIHKDYKKALISYKKSVELNPSSDNGKAYIEKINKILKG